MTDLLYGPTVLEHFRHPRNQRPLESPTAGHEAYNPLCGDRVRFEIAVRGNEIVDAAFTANACALCTASASLLTERVRGMSISGALSVEDASVVEALGVQLPASRIACAVLPLRALRHAATPLVPAT